MRQLIFVVLTAFFIACGGGEAQKQAPPEEVAEQPSPPSDPMVAACDAGTAKSCLIAGDNAEKRGEAEKAAELYAKACELDNASGCALAGGIRANSGDVAGGLELLQRGCELDEATSCYGAALVHMGMFGGQADPSKAAGALERGCSLGLADACGSLAGLLEEGSGVQADPERAQKLREQACDQGDGASCVVLASRALEAGETDKGTSLLEKACETDGTACTRRGLVALQTEQDPATARTYFERGCAVELKDVDACAWMGWMVIEGLGGDEEPGRGAALIQAACDADSATGCMFQAVTLSREGKEEDAEETLQKACELNAEQCEALRAQYEKLADGS